jgi:hypothetical protein
MPDTTQPPTDYPEAWFGSKTVRANAERRKVATIRELAKLPQDQLDRALETARNERSEGGA